MGLIWTFLTSIWSGICEGYKLIFAMMDEDCIDATATRIAVVAAMTILMPFIVIFAIIIVAIDEISFRIHQYF